MMPEIKVPSKLTSAAGDMFLNIVATLVPMAVLQLIVLPLVARDVSEGAYGVILASVSLLGLIPMTAGNVINNVRLLREEEYAGSGTNGDFSIVVAFASGACAIAVCIGSYSMGVCTVSDLASVGVASVLMLLREYLVVEYRLKLNYRGILFANIWQTVGQLIGYACFTASGIWGLIYLLGYFASDLYIIRTTTIWRDPFIITPRMRRTLEDVASLGLANIFSRITNYADRLVLIPLAGSASVSVYYVACLFGKILSLIISPINNVLLSYLVKADRISRKGFWIALGSAGALCLVGYALTMLVAHPLIELLYPQYVDAAMVYVPIATAASYVMVLSNVANPFVMRFCDLRWQTAMNATFCALFFLGTAAGFYVDDLFGFCIGILFANCVRLVLAITVYLAKSKAAGV